ncbi:flagellar biosynthetic protein FliQ [Parvularcula bermudensis HTCC2503]|uniref:Flagellar biosynthetic protein FliQ n=1 Tax=Parvularcula bermudensis (strain ATCC BAA-594 / HTCC2503 / KCTC 12087) TaxID=314260 RepID=E0TH64_PARBH|nr:flagellar biosynthetic protein FliQ [Parvularcula bermudensis]ADM09648.1 flagellar biosynthetic protein FliQ [Parvularcula bermudensis HTCC2503]
MLTDAQIIDLTREAVMTAALMSAPLLIAALVAGLIVGLLQALTSVQELTLTFVPKVAAMLLVFALTSSFMVGLCLRLFEDRILPLIG